MFDEFNRDDDNIQEEDQEVSDYEIRADSAFTKDEITHIRLKKQSLVSQLDTKKRVLKGIEFFTLNMSIYAISRWIILTAGVPGITFSCILTVLLVQIINRDVLSDARINYKDGSWQIYNMQNALKLLGAGMGGLFLIYANAGQFMLEVHHSHQTFDYLVSEVNRLSNLDQQSQNEAWTGLAIGVLGTIAIGGIMYKIVAK